jgi:hypothetical protein
MMTTDNLRVWDALSKTDPKHTKPFNRSGGFKGTAIKPIWIIRQLTDQFGPCGVGWGINEPVFQVVPADGEILVYCTVSAWHGDKANTLYGVGGDKVQAKRSSGTPFCDDEAFKKAFTDAVNNAFKFVGVGADIHMGMFEDDKYVTATKAEFAEREREETPVPASVTTMLDGLRDAARDGDIAMAAYWKQHWPGVPREWRAHVQAEKETIKAGMAAVNAVRSG